MVLIVKLPSITELALGKDIFPAVCVMVLVPVKPPRKVFVSLPAILNGAFTSRMQFSILAEEVPKAATGAVLILKMGMSVLEIVLK